MPGVWVKVAAALLPKVATMSAEPSAICCLHAWNTVPVGKVAIVGAEFVAVASCKLDPVAPGSHSVDIQLH